MSKKGTDLDLEGVLVVSEAPAVRPLQLSGYSGSPWDLGRQLDRAQKSEPYSPQWDCCLYFRQLV